MTPEAQALVERDEARQIVRDIYWMARRYADGRQSYAVGMFNDAIRKAYDAGWLEHRIEAEPPYARDSMFSPEWRSIDQENARLRERLSLIEATHGEGGVG
jgi:hypothetical protein